MPGKSRSRAVAQLFMRLLAEEGAGKSSCGAPGTYGIAQTDLDRHRGGDFGQVFETRSRNDIELVASSR